MAGKKGINLGNKNGMWKGDIVSYTALHQWVKRNKPKPELCEECKEIEPYDLANISGEYKRDTDDYKWVCRRCHMEIDGRLKKLQEILEIKQTEEWNKARLLVNKCD
jgi:hypothetical protein